MLLSVTEIKIYKTIFQTAADFYNSKKKSRKKSRKKKVEKNSRNKNCV